MLRYTVRGIGLGWQEFQSRIAKNDPIPDVAVTAVGGHQGQETVVLANGKQDRKPTAVAIDLRR